MQEKAFQDFYPDEFSHCFGCGRLNSHGHQIKTFWDKEETVTFYSPEKKYMALPGFVYGGLIASLIDCHCTGTAAAASYQKEGRPMDSEPAFRFVTASLKVDYLAPTPLGQKLEIRGRVIELKGKKVIVEARVYAKETLCATGTVVAVQLPQSMMPK